MDAVEAAILLLEKHPQLGSLGEFKHPRLRDWRFFMVFRPFNKHILFYEIIVGQVFMRRTIHGYRNLPRRLLD